MPQSGRVDSRGVWRVFAERHGRVIERASDNGSDAPPCPRCGRDLQPQAGSRLRYQPVLDAKVYDFTCAGCRRFWPIVQHTDRSLRYLRMRRLAAAVAAVGPTTGGPGAVRSLA